MKRVYFKTGVVIECRSNRRLKRVIKESQRYEGFVPYRFTTPPTEWYFKGVL